MSNVKYNLCKFVSLEIKRYLLINTMSKFLRKFNYDEQV